MNNIRFVASDIGKESYANYLLHDSDLQKINLMLDDLMNVISNHPDFCFVNDSEWFNSQDILIEYKDVLMVVNIWRNKIRVIFDYAIIGWIEVSKND